MDITGLSYNSRKALMVHIGEEAGTEICNLISMMASEIDELRKSKVDVTQIVPASAQPSNRFVDKSA